MHNSAENNIIGLLLLINRLQQTNQPLGRSTIVPFAEMKLPRVAQEYEALVGTLLEEKLIEGQAELFFLTLEGQSMVGRVSQQHSLHAWFYNEYYQAVLNSEAHALFCEQVYGKNLSQHGMADMAQIHALLAALQIEAGMTILDFGCGDGQITEYIADTTQTIVVGIDIADYAIELAQNRTQAKRDRMQFYWVDLERQPDYFTQRHFDRIVAIDSIFFVQDQQVVVERLIQQLTPQGKLGIFYICPPHAKVVDMPLTQALDRFGVSYCVKDFSVQNREHWIKKKQVLLELEPMFSVEGNEFLFKNRLAECDGLEHIQRYLYVITIV